MCRLHLELSRRRIDDATPLYTVQFARSDALRRIQCGIDPAGKFSNGLRRKYR